MRPDLTNQASPLATPPAVAGLEPVAAGLSAPMMLTEPGDGSERRFIVDQIGLVQVLAPGGVLLDEPFLDLRGRLVHLNPHYDECGLLSLALHPGYATNGRLFVFYSVPLRPDGSRHRTAVGVLRSSAAPGLPRSLLQDKLVLPGSADGADPVFR